MDNNNENPQASHSQAAQPTSQAAFEAWALVNGFKVERRNDANSPDTYFRHETEQRWIVWQAAHIAGTSQAKQPSEPTDISQRLRERAGGGYTAVRVEDGALMLAAAAEIERYYGGMLAWKQTAEKKDRDWNAERMGRVNDRIAERASQATKAQDEPGKQIDTPEFWALMDKYAHESACEDFNKAEYDASRKAILDYLAAPVAKEAPAVPALAALQQELNRITWEGEDEGWNLAIAAVQKRIGLLLAVELVASVAKEATRDAETGSVQVKTWQERRQNGSNFERAMLDEIADLRRVLGNIVANAEVQADARMGGKTDCYAVPLDDVEAARKAIPEPRAEAIQIEGEPDESFYRRVVFNNGWNACLKEFRATTTSTVSAPLGFVSKDAMASLKAGKAVLTAISPEEIIGNNQAVYLGAQKAPEEVRDPIRELVAEHTELLEENAYTYFELAYTRRTEWMAWLCTNAREADPNRKVLASGQGSTPEEACESALAALRTSSTDQANADTGSAA